MPVSMKIRVAPTIAALVLLSACGEKPAADTAKVAADVKNDMMLSISAFNSHDAEKAVMIDAPDYVSMFHGVANVVGPEQDLAVTRQQVADAAAKVIVANETVDVAAAGDMAVWRATYDYTYTDPATKAPRTEHGNWLVGFRKQADGALKASWGVVSDLPAAKD